MKIVIDYDLRLLLDTVLKQILKPYDLRYELRTLGAIEIQGQISYEAYDALKKDLAAYGISIINDHKYGLVEKIKRCISAYLLDEEIHRTINFSTYLARECNYSYAHLSGVFSAITYSSIENFVILKKIDLAKRLLNSGKFTLTEIAHKLGYSSVSHLSTQFKNTTGLSPTLYCKIITKKQENESMLETLSSSLINET